MPGVTPAAPYILHATPQSNYRQYILSLLKCMPPSPVLEVREQVLTSDRLTISRVVQCNRCKLENVYTFRVLTAERSRKIKNYRLGNSSSRKGFLNMAKIFQTNILSSQIVPYLRKINPLMFSAFFPFLSSTCSSHGPSFRSAIFCVRTIIVSTIYVIFGVFAVQYFLHLVFDLSSYPL